MNLDDDSDGTEETDNDDPDDNESDTDDNTDVENFPEGPKQNKKKLFKMSTKLKMAVNNGEETTFKQDIESDKFPEHAHMYDEKLKVYNCTICAFKSKWLKNVTRHVREKHLRERYRCNLCGATFAGRPTLRDHIQYAHKAPLMCSVCNKTFKSKEGLNGHEKQHRGEGNYKCHICDRVFLTKSHLDGHQNSHLKAKPYACAKCNKKYGYKSSLLEHVKHCSGPKPTVFPCPEGSCGEIFRNKNSLKEHINAKHKSTLFVCQKCGRDFEWRQSYYRHKKSCKVGDNDRALSTDLPEQFEQVEETGLANTQTQDS